MALTEVLADDEHSITFRRDDGSTHRALRTPQAEELAARLRPAQKQAPVETSYAPEQAAGWAEKLPVVGPIIQAERAAGTAAPSKGGAAGVIPVVRDIAAAKQAANEVAPKPSAKDLSGQTQAPARPAGAPAPPPTAAPQPAGVPMRPPSDQEIADGSAAQMVADAKRPYYVAPQPAISQEQWQQKAGSATVLPSQGSQKTEGIKPPLPAELQADISRSYEQRAGQLEEQRDASFEQAQDQHIELLQRADQIKTEINAQTKAVADVKAQRREWERRLATADEEIKNFEVDPNRFFKERGPWAVIVAAIAQGLGAYGAAMSGSPNFAMNIIQGAIDRDIEAQRQDYITKKDTQHSLVARLTQSLGDLDAATEKAKELQLTAAQNYGNQLALTSKRLDIQNAWVNASAQIEAERLKYRVDLIDRGGVSATAMSGKAVYPQAATRGGMVTPSPAMQQKRLKAAIEWSDLVARAAGRLDSKQRQEVNQKLQIARGEAEAVGVKPEVLNAYSKQRGAITAMEPALKEAENLLKKFEGKDIPGHGATGMYPEVLLTDAGQDVRQSAANLVAAYVQSISGAAATDQEVERLTRVVMGRTDRSFKRGVQMLRRQLDSRLNSLDATYKETGAVDTRERGFERARELAQQNMVAGRKGIGNAAVQEIENYLNTNVDLVMDGPETE